jgi:hypothetical protein
VKNSKAIIENLSNQKFSFRPLALAQVCKARRGYLPIVLPLFARNSWFSLLMIYKYTINFSFEVTSITAA